MSATIFFPTRNVRYEHPRAHDVFESRVQTLQSTLDILQTLHGLRVSIIDADNLTVITKCRRSGNVDTFADADGAGIADDRFPFCAGRNSMAFSHDDLRALPYGRATAWCSVLASSVSYQWTVGIWPAIAKELPGVAHFANQIQI